jgi:ribosome-associated toxin RatA of RatAB toxin-antitoxin module
LESQRLATFLSVRWYGPTDCWSSTAHVNRTAIKQSLYTVRIVLDRADMINFKRRASVTCRLSDAFEYVADWNNYKSFVPMLSAMEPTAVVQYGIGASFDVTMVFGSVEISTTLDVVEFAKNKSLTMKSSRGVRTNTKWEFKDIGGKVLVTMDFDYDLPPSLALHPTEKDSITKSMEDAVGRSIELLKWVLENQPPDKDDDY